MLNKLLSNLPFNPSLIGQISFYAKRLKKETAVRRMGFIMLILAMAVQLFAAMSPPQATLAKSSNDLIYGGFTEKSQAVLHCLNSQSDYHVILANYGINCTNVDHAEEVSLNPHDRGDQLFSMGRNPYHKPGEQPVNIAGANGEYPLYLRYLWGWGSQNYRALHGTTDAGLEFWILFDCGNLTFVGIPTPVTPPVQPPVITDNPSIGNLDVVDCKNIAGWGFDQDQPATAIHVHIYIDGIGVADLVANQSRPDVGAAYPSAGANHGYSMATPASIKNTSTHTVYAYAIGINASGNTNGVNPLLASRTVTLGTCKTQPPFKPGVASCESLKAIDLKHRAYSFVAATTGERYTPKKYSFNFGDKTAPLVVTTSLKTSAVGHTYAKAGTYKAVVTIDVAVQNTATTTVAKTITCQVTVTVKDVQPPKKCDEQQSSDNLEACLTPHKSAKNISRGGTDANGTTAHAGETIEYTLSDKNIGKITVPKHVIRENISDILDYADVTDFHGGKLDKYNIVSWPAVDIKAGKTESVRLTVKIKDPIPETPASASDPNHFDHQMSNVYGDSVVINLPGNVVTLTQTVNGKLINTGPGTSIAMIVGLTVVVGYFFARSRLLSEEIDIVRTEYAATGGL